MHVKIIYLPKPMKNIKGSGGAGYRSRYLSHAKRALYHLSYAPDVMEDGCRYELNITTMIYLHSSKQFFFSKFQCWICSYFYSKIANIKIDQITSNLHWKNYDPNHLKTKFSKSKQNSKQTLHLYLVCNNFRCGFRHFQPYL